MIANQKAKICLFILAVLFTACSAKPPRMEEFPSTADASGELQTTERMLTEAKTNNLDILAPKSYERAEESLNDARKALTKGKSKEKVLKNIAESRGWLSEAQTRGEVTRTASKGLADARSGAIQANAPTLYPKEFEDIEENTRELAEEAERGDVKTISRRADALTQSYLKLETDSVVKNSLGEAQLNLAVARKEGAAKSSPKTLAATEEKLNSALALIAQNPRNTNAIKKAASEATEQSQFLLQVNQKTKAGNTEDLVLQTERQKRQISGLASEQARTESQMSTQQAELMKKEGALNAAAELRRQLKPNEAEVFVENNAVKVRLKGVQFGSNKTELNKKSTALLEKVDQALGTVGAASIVVEGHTDSVGSSEVNQEISEKRAQAVQNFLVQKGQIAADQVRAVGLGEEGAISDNKTSRGRAENRRIDLVIEPKIE